jgi:hypothetical protein
MLYITLLDQFHPGIYSSQVIDVCDYLNKKHNAKIRVVAFLSLKELLETDSKKELKKLSPDAIVLPAFPGIKHFELTVILLFFVCLFTGQKKVICRNAFCAKMALRLKKIGVIKKVVLDGRSSLSAEIEEYDVFPVDYFRNNVRRIEKFSVENADFRMAVSNQLVEYWRENYNYTGTRHIVIPCTLDAKYFKKVILFEQDHSSKIKKELGISESDIVLAYSGSAAPWQSFKLLEKLFLPILGSNPRIKILFLSKETIENKSLQIKFPERVLIKWVKHRDVINYLAACDYGILLREQSYTNKVASPTKFAEYLFAGLPVLISNDLGDFSEFVKLNHCGIILSEEKGLEHPLNKTSTSQKEYCHILAQNNFTKDAKANAESYSTLVEFLES